MTSAKRLLSLLIDVVVVFIPSYLSFVGQTVFALHTLFFIDFALVTALSSFISGKGTIGDRFLSLTTVSVLATPLSKLKLTFRNLSYCLYLFLAVDRILDHSSDFTENMVLVSLVVCLYLAVFSNKNIYKQNMTGLDALFKTTIIEKPWHVA